MRVSNLLRSYEVLDLKAQLEANQGKQTKAQIAAFYSEIRYASSSEAVSQTFVEVSLMLHSSALHIPEVRDVCHRFDALGLRNPMDSVRKIREVVVGCNKQHDAMAWAFPMLWDWWHFTDNTDPISLRSLKGDLPGHGGKSLIEWLLFKKTVRDYLYKRMEKLNWDLKIKSRIRFCTESVDMCRQRWVLQTSHPSVPSSTS